MIKMAGQKPSWMKPVGILGIVLGVAAIAAAFILWFAVYPGGTFELGRPNLWLYLVAWIGGAVAIIAGIILILLKGKKEEKKPEGAKKEIKVKCKACGEIFKASGLGGSLKCPACGATGKIE